jgi:protein-S-isoprenylcysteine O-methyltransferase Ste14
MATETHIQRITTLLRGVLDPEPGRGRIALAVAFGLTVHLVFAAGVLAMVLAMYFGMSESLGAVPWPYAAVANALLILQFPAAHSFFLTGPGTKILARLIPGPHGGTLGTTTYAIVASLQLFLLFAFWTPSGIIWWQAEGWALYVITTLYALSWLLLLKASWDAGAEVQAGALGWMSLMKNARPRFPDMPTTGLFRIIRQPIYVAFALTLWTVPVWTPDQLVLAIAFTAYCLFAPKLKERRFEKRYGDRFRDYQKDVPYVLPDLMRTSANVEHSPK